MLCHAATHVQVRVERAEELPRVKMSKNGPSTWVVLRYGTAQHQTVVARKTLLPVWQNNFRLPLCGDEPMHFLLCRKSKLHRFKVISSAALTVPRMVRPTLRLALVC